MLSYQHEYHAGNHADVLKHSVLALALTALQRKEAPLRVLDSHAGSGAYSLASQEARKTGEHETGIGRLLAADSPPELLAGYLAAVRKENPAGGPMLRYPGSPRLAQFLLRPGDQLELMELHPRSLTRLRQNCGRDRRVHIHQRDAFEGLPALVPPPERRGLVLIDPAYEVKEDFGRVLKTLLACHQRWPGGTYLVWYPLIRNDDAERFPGKVAESGIRRIYHAGLQVESGDFPGLRGSGLLIVNLPFGVEQQLAALVPWLWQVLAVDGRGSWQARWLVPE